VLFLISKGVLLPSALVASFKTNLKTFLYRDAYINNTSRF
jgi:hypothetical protein